MLTAKTSKARRKFSEEVTVLDYVHAGSASAAHVGLTDVVSCVCCGSQISHVFLSSVGPLGGDCAATLTGENHTRAAVRRAIDKVRHCKAEVGEIDVSPNGARWDVSYTVRGSGWVRESDGVVVGARTRYIASGLKSELAARVVASAVRAWLE
jgi:hypothetical protein